MRVILGDGPRNPRSRPAVSHDGAQFVLSM